MRRTNMVDSMEFGNAESGRRLSRAGVLCSVAMMLIVGCGTAEYERRYDKTIEELWRLEPFLELQEETTTFSLTKPGAKQPVTAQLRLPKQFDSTAKRYDLATTGDEPVDPLRKLPPFARSLPDFRFSYEQFIGKPGSPQDSMYMYVYAGISKRSPFASQLESAIRKAYKGIKASDLKDGWEPTECPAPNKSEVEWNRLTLRLPDQTFAVKTGQEVTKKEFDGMIEAYVHRDGDKHVMFILRMPASLEKQIDLNALAKACAGTLRWADNEDDEDE